MLYDGGELSGNNLRAGGYRLTLGAAQASSSGEADQAGAINLELSEAAFSAAPALCAAL